MHDVYALPYISLCCDYIEQHVYSFGHKIISVLNIMSKPKQNTHVRVYVFCFSTSVDIITLFGRYHTYTTFSNESMVFKIGLCNATRQSIKQQCKRNKEQINGSSNVFIKIKFVGRKKMPNKGKQIRMLTGNFIYRKTSSIFWQKQAIENF